MKSVESECHKSSGRWQRMIDRSAIPAAALGTYDVMVARGDSEAHIRAVLRAVGCNIESGSTMVEEYRPPAPHRARVGNRPEEDPWKWCSCDEGWHRESEYEGPWHELCGEHHEYGECPLFDHDGRFIG